MWNAQGENLMDGDLCVIYPEWVHQSVARTVCFQLKHASVSIYRNVRYHLVKLVNVA